MTRKVYLAGGIFGLPDRGQWWREYAIDKMPEGWEAINPNLVELDKIKPKDVVDADYAAIRECAAVIARVAAPSWGTAMELQFSHSISVPVIGFPFVRPPIPGNYSPWLIHHVNYYETTIDECLRRLKDV